MDEAYYTYGYIAGTSGMRRPKKNIGLTGAKSLRPIDTMRHVSVPSEWSVFTLSVVFIHLPEQRMLGRSAIISINYAARCHGMHFPLFVNYWNFGDNRMIVTSKCAIKKHGKLPDFFNSSPICPPSFSFQTPSLYFLFDMSYNSSHLRTNC